MATSTVAMGDELEVIQTELLGFKSLAGDAKVQLTSAWFDPPSTTASLLTIAPRKRLVAGAGPDAIAIVHTDAARKAFESPRDDDSEARPVDPLVKLTVSTPTSHLAFTTDEQYLLVASQLGGGIAVYETASLLSGSQSPAFGLSTDGVVVRALCPNVAIEKAELCAVVTENGALHMVNLKSRTMNNIIASDVSCMGWSTKGKQLVAGKANGTIQQMTPEGDIKAEIPCPDGFHGVHVSSIQWLENHLFVAIYITPNENPPSSSYFAITRQPPSSYNFRKIPDPVDPFGSEKVPHHGILRLKDFPPNLQDVLVVSSTESPDIGLLTRSKTPLSSDFQSEDITGVFTMTEMLDDTRRAGLPMDTNCNNSVPVGMALDLSARDTVYKPIPAEELDESPGPVPAVWVLTNEGVLVAWWLIYNESITGGTTYPNMAALLPDLEESVPVQPITPATPAKPVAPPSALVPSTAAPSTPAAPAPSAFGNASTVSAFGSASRPGPKFGASGFGASTAASASPAFGQPSAIGAGKATFGSKASAWAPSDTTASSAPAFGQSGFASYGATQSPFGAAAGESSPSAFAGPAKTGGFSSFASSGGGFSSFGGSGDSSGGSIFGQTSGATASPFASASTTDTAFKSTGSSTFGNGQPFKLQSSFTPQKIEEDEELSDTKPSTNESPFSTGFGAALDSSNTHSKDEDMEPVKATPAKTPLRSIFGAETKIGTPETKTPLAKSNNSSDDSSTPPKPVFEEGNSSAQLTPEVATPVASKTLFGSSSTPSATPKSTFGQPSTGFNQATTPAQTKPIFATPKPAEESTTPATANKSVFGQPSRGFGGTSSTTPSQAKSLFATSKPVPETTTPAKPVPIFDPPSKIPVPGASRTSIFGTPSSSTPPSKQPVSNVFAKSLGQSKTLFGSTTALDDEDDQEDSQLEHDESELSEQVEEELSQGEDEAEAQESEEDENEAEQEEDEFEEEVQQEDEVKEEESEEEFNGLDSDSEESTTPAPKEKSSRSLIESFTSSDSVQEGADSIFDSTTPAKTTTLFGKAYNPPAKGKIFGSTEESSPADRPTPEAKNPFAASTTPTTTPAPSRFSFISSTSVPLPPNSTSKSSYTAGDISSSSTSKKGVSDDDSTFLKPSLPKASNKSAWTMDGASQMESSLLTKKPSGKAGSSIGQKFKTRKPVLPESEEEFGEESQDEASGLHDSNKHESDLEFDEGVVHVSKEISPSSSSRTQSSFTGLNGPFTIVPKPTALDKTSLFSESLSKPSAIFTPPTQTSPRSPSPMRTAVPNRVMRAEGIRSVSAPGLPSSILGQGPGKPFGIPILGSNDSQVEENPFIAHQRKAKAKQEAEEAKPLIDDEDDEVQKLLSCELQPTLEIDQLMAHTDVAPPAHDSIPAQVEAVYRDINSMVDTIGLNARSVMQFVLGHSKTDGTERQKDDLESSDDWVLCNLADLTDIIEIDLANDLDRARVSHPEEKKADCEDIMRNMTRLRSKQQDLQVILARLDPNQAEVFQNLPLSPEQAAQQNELRREYAQFTQKLVEVEEALTMLKTRIATASQAVGKGKAGAAQVPTVEAVMRTITKMTSMAEKRSGDVDVLETQMRKLRLASATPTRDLVLRARTSTSTSAAPGTPRTPQRHLNKRASLFSPERSTDGAALFSPATPRASSSQALSSSLLGDASGPFRASVSMTPVRDHHLAPAGSLTPTAGAGVGASPVRRKMSGFSSEEKAQLMGKKARKRAVLDKLKAQVEQKRVTVWEMETME
ncbi:uncharacterized protein BROUX77_006806 [Berkeleyomyces rouxiae]|uniref:uncharacterized protein n=1 Tax=Berkeleyomyces rouxiae TaxID=2035830 RepID=UPI003B80E600